MTGVSNFLLLLQLLLTNVQEILWSRLEKRVRKEMQLNEYVSCQP